MIDANRTYELQALTDLWTGDATTATSKKADRLVPTGLLGSIRWWFEVLVRGLGGAPCDPSATQKACLDLGHCVVCELFGCTGWARKVRFDVRDAQGAVILSQIKKGTTFALRFTPLRAVRSEEWALLEFTLRLICRFGALGGKTVLKPSEQNQKQQHRDFGLVRWAGAPSPTHSRNELEKYVQKWVKNGLSVNGAEWASCSHMWFVAGKHLSRQDDCSSTFNRVLGRPEPKKPSGGDSWLAGRPGESKKVFSFKSPERTFGFVEKEGELQKMRGVLQRVWSISDSGNEWFIAGDALLDRLFEPGEISR